MITTTKSRFVAICRFVLTIGVASLLLSTTSARADVEPAVSVPIHTLINPGDTFEQFFSEIPDTIHTKNLLFEGTATTLAGAVAILDIQFDWFDPSIGGIVLTPDNLLTVQGGAPVPFSIPWTIPFCPPEVSLHLTNVANASSVPIQVDGVFTYQCVPEPSTLVLFGLALASLTAYRLRKRRV